MKTHIPKSQENLQTIENLLKTFAIQPFQNDGVHHFSIKEIKPESQMPSLFDKEVIISLSDSDHDVTQMQNLFLTLEFKMNLLFDNKFDKFDDTYKEEGRPLMDPSRAMQQLNHLFIILSNQNQRKNNNRFVHSLYENVHKDDISCCGRYLSIKEISEVLAPQTSSPYAMPVGFTVSIPLGALLIFSAFSEYPNSLFGDLKIKFNINPSAFVFCQVDPIQSMTKYYTINKDELLSSGQDKLKDIDLFFRNWSLTFQHTNMYTQIGCTADLVTGIRAEELTLSGLKNIVCDIKPVTVSVRNYIIEAVTANICGYKASESCLYRVRQFYQSRPYVVPAQRIETWVFPSAASSAGIKTTQNIPLSHVIDMCLLFPKDARHVTCYENPCDFDMQINTMNINFPDFPMNILNEQFFTMQLQANNLDNIFESCDEYEDSLATPRASKTRRYNPVSDYTSFFITIQCERNSNGALTLDGLDTQNQNISIELKGHTIFAGQVDTYYNVDTNGKHPPPPILCTVHDNFWLFSPVSVGSCLYDRTHSFDQVINQVIA
ncbi:MAG: hypothetical protein EZS28_019494 [Streblomastix strix]|uniref:Uncharacterized protein n=1 Tax=Streblomastix strix TaxID=222440 RepID=A0A5J4VQT0_9EUKA|nr:MAG: hypothetical protein EZS28_019494 [Streblomastix strix]